MSAYNFENPTRQSKKGIIVIFGLNFYAGTKQSILFISLFFLSYLKNQSYASNPYFLLSCCLFIFFMILHAVLKYYNFKFHVTEEYFILNQGILNKEKISISKTKIQNVYIKQNLIQQVINVVSLSIETAGDEDTEIEIHALSADSAIELKKVLLKKSVAFGFHSEINYPEKVSIYHKASIKKLLLEGISENHYKSFILILFFLSATYYDLKDFLDPLILTKTDSIFFNLNMYQFSRDIIFNCLLIFSLFILVVLFSVVKTFIENFDLTVSNNTNGLEISKGLFNKINLGLLPSRIQNTTIITNRLKQFFGLYKLTFTQAMVNKKQRKNLKIIGLNEFQVSELLLKFYPKIFDVIEKRKPESYFIYKSLMYYLVLILIVNLVFFFLPYMFCFINIPVIFLFVLNIIYGYKKSYYSIDDSYLVLGSGNFINTQKDILELHKIQAVSLKQTIFQKRRRLASVEVFSASNNLEIPHIKLEVAKQIVNYMLYKVESTPKDWM